MTSMATVIFWYICRYKRNMYKLSGRIFNQRQSQMDRTVKLLEGVAKSKGGKHLVMQSKDLWLAQLLCLDMVLFYSLVTFASWKLLNRALK